MAYQEQVSAFSHSIVHGTLVEPNSSPLPFSGVHYAADLDHRSTVDSISGIYSERDVAARPNVVGTKDEGWVLRPLNLEIRVLPDLVIRRRHQDLGRLAGADVLDLGAVGPEQLIALTSAEVVKALQEAEKMRKLVSQF